MSVSITMSLCYFFFGFLNFLFIFDLQSLAISTIRVLPILNSCSFYNLFLLIIHVFIFLRLLLVILSFMFLIMISEEFLNELRWRLIKSLKFPLRYIILRILYQCKKIRNRIQISETKFKPYIKGHERNIEYGTSFTLKIQFFFPQLQDLLIHKW